MISFTHLTDAPAPAQSRDGFLQRVRAAQLAGPELGLARRILARQWYNATPAQALLCLSVFPDANLKAPQGFPSGLAIAVDPEDAPACRKHWGTQGSVKEANALIRLLDGDFGTAGREVFLARCAWLVEATQAEIQSFLRDAVNLPAPVAGRVQLPGLHGCQGFLMHAELFPRIPKPTTPRPTHDNCSLLAMVEG